MSTIVGTNIEVTNLKYDSDTTSMIISNAGQVTIQGEGTATTNLQQGLIKVWTNFNGEGTIATRDSFNTASLTDNSTGSYSINFTNNFNAASWSGAANCQQDDTVNPGSSYMDVCQINRTQQTSFAKVMTNLNFSNTHVGDAKYVQILLSGDLA